MTQATYNVIKMYTNESRRALQEEGGEVDRKRTQAPETSVFRTLVAPGACSPGEGLRGPGAVAGKRGFTDPRVPAPFPAPLLSGFGRDQGT